MNPRRILLWLHRWVGVVAGLVILVAAVTGLLIVIERPLNRWLSPELYPQKSADGACAPVEQALAVLREKFPEARVDGIGLPRGGRDALMLFAGQRVTHFDPASGELLGSRPRRTGFTQTLVKLHVNLLAGPAGGTVVVVATILTIGLALSGLWLWWPLRIGWFRRGANFRRFNLELHSVAGLYSSFFLLVIAITGVTLRYLHTEHPRVPAASPPAVASERITVDAAIQRAEIALPGTRAAAIEMPGPNPRALPRAARISRGRLARRTQRGLSRPLQRKCARHPQRAHRHMARALRQSATLAAHRRSRRAAGKDRRLPRLHRAHPANRQRLRALVETPGGTNAKLERFNKWYKPHGLRDGPWSAAGSDSATPPPEARNAPGGL